MPSARQPTDYLVHTSEPDPTAQLHLSLEPGQTIAPHEAPMDVPFFVLEGSGTALMGNESMPVSANTLIESPKGNPHGFSNTGSGLFRVLAIKTPAAA